MNDPKLVLGGARIVQETEAIFQPSQVGKLSEDTALCQTHQYLIKFSTKEENPKGLRIESPSTHKDV